MSPASAAGCRLAARLPEHVTATLREQQRGDTLGARRTQPELPVVVAAEGEDRSLGLEKG